MGDVDRKRLCRHRNGERSVRKCLSYLVGNTDGNGWRRAMRPGVTIPSGHHNGLLNPTTTGGSRSVRLRWIAGNSTHVRVPPKRRPTCCPHSKRPGRSARIRNSFSCFPNRAQPTTSSASVPTASRANVAPPRKTRLQLQLQAMPGKSKVNGILRIESDMTKVECGKRCFLMLG